jgi:hypothetical protein
MPSFKPGTFPVSKSTDGQEIVVAHDYSLAISQQEITGYEYELISSHNLSAGTTEEDMWFQGGLMTWLTTASLMDVVSSSTDDDGNPTTSIGAQTIRIHYLDSSFNEQTEDVTLDGTTLVTTSASMLRIQKAEVLTVGTYHGSNVGNITIRVTGAGAIQANIEAGIGKTQKSHWTIPNGKTGYVKRFDANVDSAKTSTLRFFQYTNADDITQPFGGAKIQRHVAVAVSGDHREEFSGWLQFPAKTDIWWTSTAGAASTDIQLDYDLYMVAD